MVWFCYAMATLFYLHNTDEIFLRIEKDKSGSFANQSLSIYCCREYISSDMIGFPSVRN